MGEAKKCITGTGPDLLVARAQFGQSRAEYFSLYGSDALY